MSRARILADYVAGGSTAAEFDVLDGLTSTTAELNYVDGVTSNVQTQMDAKASSVSPVLVTPNLGTPSAGIMTNMTGAVTASIVDDAVTGAKIENNPTIAGNLTVSGDIVPSTPLSHRNILINGAMNVWQRRTSSEAGLGALAGTAGYRLADRWAWTLDGPARVTLSQETDAPDGFAYSYKLDCTTTNSGDSGVNRAYFEQRIEGLNLQQLQKGYATAQPVTLSFWIKTVITGVTDPIFRVNLQDAENTRILGGSYTYDTSEGGWQQFKITFAGDTSTSHKITADTANRMFVEWWLYDAGYYKGGAIPTSWESQADNDRNHGATGNVMGNTANYWMITGVQLELGSNATPFEHRSYGEELARCERYFQTLGKGMVGRIPTTGNVTLGGTLHCMMRTGPSVTIADGSDGFTDYVEAGGGVEVPGIDEYQLFAMTQSTGGPEGIKVACTKSDGGPGETAMVGKDRVFLANAEL